MSKNISKRGPRNRRSLGFAPPDFLWKLVALTDLMRLSLRERRTRNLVQCHAAGNPGRDDKGKGNGSIESGCRTEAFFNTLGGPQAHDSSGRDDNSSYTNKFVMSTGAYPDFLLATPDRTTCAAFIKESHMKFAGATNPNRKSGVA
jgi:hypothetical protein